MISLGEIRKRAIRFSKEWVQSCLGAMLADDMKLDSPRNRAYKWADMFFVYDAIELGTKKAKCKIFCMSIMRQIPIKQPKINIIFLVLPRFAPKIQPLFQYLAR